MTEPQSPPMPPIDAAREFYDIAITKTLQKEPDALLYATLAVASFLRVICEDVEPDDPEPV